MNKLASFNNLATSAVLLALPAGVLLGLEMDGIKTLFPERFLPYGLCVFLSGLFVDIAYANAREILGRAIVGVVAIAFLPAGMMCFGFGMMDMTDSNKMWLAIAVMSLPWIGFPALVIDEIGASCGRARSDQA